MKYVIIGGGTAGLSCATKIRRNDETAQITIVEQGLSLAITKNGFANAINPSFNPSKLDTVSNGDVLTRYNLKAIFETSPEKIDEVDKKITLTNGEVISYDKLVIAIGKKVESNNYVINNVEDLNTLSAMLKENNKKVINVVTDNIYGLEVASNLKLINENVNLVFDEAEVLAGFDLELRADIINLLANIGITFDKAFKADNTIDVLAKASCELTKLAKLDVDQEGLIKVDSNFKTSNPDIYAIGSVIEQDFNANAAKKGRDLANHLTNGTNIKVDKVKSIYFTIANQEFAAINFTDVKEADESVIVHRLSHASYVDDASNLTIKVNFKNNGEITSVMMSGNGVLARVNPVVMAMNANMTIAEFEEQPFLITPSLSMGKEQLVTAMSSALRVNDKYKNFYFDQVDGINGQVIDIRTPLEYDMAHIEGSINIELNSLRNNLDKIDKNEPVYVYCQAGLRANVAISILKEYGCSNVYNLSGGFKTYQAVKKYQENLQKQVDVPAVNDEITEFTSNETKGENNMQIAKQIDATALQCPGPIMQVYNAMNELSEMEILEITVSDFGFKNDIVSWCEKTGNTLINCETNNAGKIVALIQKGSSAPVSQQNTNDSATIVLFSGELDKALAAMIIAQGAASLGKKVTIFCTFWGLNALRKSEKVNVKKPINEKMFGAMMPRGADKLGISNMNMMGMGAKMIKKTMKDKDVYSLPELMQQAKDSGVEFIACTMSMDVMGIHEEELLDYVTYGGVAKYVSESETAGLTLFI